MICCSFFSLNVVVWICVCVWWRSVLCLVLDWGICDDGWMLLLVWCGVIVVCCCWICCWICCWCLCRWNFVFVNCDLVCGSGVWLIFMYFWWWCLLFCGCSCWSCWRWMCCLVRNCVLLRLCWWYWRRLWCFCWWLLLDMGCFGCDVLCCVVVLFCFWLGCWWCWVG